MREYKLVYGEEKFAMVYFRLRSCTYNDHT